ncbi:MAG: DUF2252 domain-containing protein [Bacteroidales bacterium]
MKKNSLKEMKKPASKVRSPKESSSLDQKQSEQLAYGRQLREIYPRNDHKKWEGFVNRPDPVQLIQQTNKGRIPELIPLRHGRMVQSPFTFYRAGAYNMAVDLAKTPNTGVKLQCCGDAHLCNFGAFATPERKIIFSVNDLDETLPAPWEWDLKRLSTSFVIACRNNGLSENAAKETVLECVRSYRESMATFSEMTTLAVWYYRIDADMILDMITDPSMKKRALNRIEKENKKRIAEEIFPKLITNQDNNLFFKDQLPTIFHWEDHKPGEINSIAKQAFNDYKENLPPAYRHLLNKYEFKDLAIKVVGVGSVGTACWVLLLVAGDKDHLILQAKEARPSVLEEFAGKSIYPNHGQRVVNGYQLMQPASDIFLGWTSGKLGRNFYIRQLRDMKINFIVETFRKAEMLIYAKLCSKALALSHARCGNPSVLSSYMGKGDIFDRAISAFSIAYADQNERDYTLFKNAVKNGKLEAIYE